MPLFISCALSCLLRSTGEVGKIVEDDQSDGTFKVKANGDTWWYQRKALEKVTGEGSCEEDDEDESDDSSSDSDDSSVKSSDSEERPSVGDKVKLTKEYKKYGDAGDGPLKPGADLIYTS